MLPFSHRAFRAGLLPIFILAFQSASLGAATPAPPAAKAATEALHVDCQMDSATGRITGHGKASQIFLSASLSKLVVTLWALETWGPSSQFETRIHILQAGGKTRVHFEGGADPIWTYEKILGLQKILAKRGVSKIDRLTFDEGVPVYLDLLKNPATEKYYVPFSSVQVAQNLKLMFNTSTWTEKLKALQQQIAGRADNFETVKVEFVNREQFKVELAKWSLSAGADTNGAGGYSSFKIRGPQLVDILKVMNATSNNYLADYLHSRIGTPEESMRWQATKKFREDVILQNGSGLVNKSGWNTITCQGALWVMADLAQVLGKSSLGLDSVLLVEGEVSPTMDFSKSPQKHFVVKTGTLYDTPVAHMAGAYVRNGDLQFFADMNQPTNREETLKVRANRPQVLREILKNQNPEAIFELQNPMPNLNGFDLISDSRRQP